MAGARSRKGESPPIRRAAKAMSPCPPAAALVVGCRVSAMLGLDQDGSSQPCTAFTRALSAFAATYAVECNCRPWRIICWPDPQKAVAIPRMFIQSGRETPPRLGSSLPYFWLLDLSGTLRPNRLLRLWLGARRRRLLLHHRVGPAGWLECPCELCRHTFANGGRNGGRRACPALPRAGSMLC